LNAHRVKPLAPRRSSKSRHKCCP